MLRFEGDKDFRQPVGLLFGKLTDARFLLSCVPGVENVAKAEPTLAVWTLRPGFTFARGTIDITLQVLDIVPETSARIVAQSKGIGSSSEVEATLALTPLDEGTRVHWTAEVKSLGGLLKAVPQGLIKASAQKVIGDVWTAVESKV